MPSLRVPFFLPLRMFVLLAALAMTLSAQGAGWESVGAFGFSSGTAVTPFLTIDPDDDAPVVTYQSSAFSASVTEKHSAAGWQILGPGFATTGTGWYHVSAWLEVPGTPAHDLLVFTRDYGAVDGHLKRYDFQSGGWIDHPLAAPMDAHDVWIDVNSSNPSSPFHNIPVVSFSDRSTNPTLPVGSLGYNPNLDFVTVKKFENGNWVPLGPVPATDTVGKHSTVKVADDGTVWMAYRDLWRASSATVQRFDPSTESWSFAGPPGFTSHPANNLQMDLAPGGIPRVSCLDGAGAIRVYEYDATTDSWFQLGGPASASDQATIAGASWRMRVPITHDSTGAPYVAYNLAGSPGRAVVRRYDAAGGLWEAVGDPTGATPGTATYLSLAVDSLDRVHLCYTDGAFANRVSVIRSPAAEPPVVLGPGCSLPATVPVASLSGSGLGPLEGQPYTFSIAGGPSQAAGVLYAGSAGSPPYWWIGPNCLVYLWIPIVQVASFTTDAAGGIDFPFLAPAGTAGLEFALQAIVLDGAGGWTLTDGLACTVQAP